MRLNDAQSPTGQPLVMPLAWTRQSGDGRLFFCAAGNMPEHYACAQLTELVKRGLLWAAR